MRKIKTMVIAVLSLLLAICETEGQNLNVRSNDFKVDLSDTKNLNTSVPMIEWIAPANETHFLQEHRLHINIQITSSKPIKEVTVSVKEKNQGDVRGEQSIFPKQEESNKLTIDKDIRLMDGINVVEITVENIDGMTSKSFRTVHVGETALADAAKLSRTDYALVFVTDKYDNWSPLVNPVFDGRTIATNLQKHYGFKVDFVENASQDQVFRKLREYSEKKYQPLDQLLIFFAGHGYFDETFKEGYVVVKESVKDDPGKTSYVSYNRLRSVINFIPSEHTLLMMDVCFGGTFDEAIAASRADDVYSDISQSQFIVRRLAMKTRKYLTSGGKFYVSDGIPGKHSPFARRVIDALNTLGGSDGILTLTELWPFVEKLNPEPRLGKFGDDAPGSEFVFVVK